LHCRSAVRREDLMNSEKKQLSAIEMQNIIKYLNDQFYQFP